MIVNPGVDVYTKIRNHWKNSEKHPKSANKQPNK